MALPLHARYHDGRLWRMPSRTAIRGNVIEILALIFHAITLANYEEVCKRVQFSIYENSAKKQVGASLLAPC